MQTSSLSWLPQCPHPLPRPRPPSCASSHQAAHCIHLARKIMCLIIIDLPLVPTPVGQNWAPIALHWPAQETPRPQVMDTFLGSNGLIWATSCRIGKQDKPEFGWTAECSGRLIEEGGCSVVEVHTAGTLLWLRALVFIQPRLCLGPNLFLDF